MLLGAVSLVLAVLGFVDWLLPGASRPSAGCCSHSSRGFALATVATRDRRPERAVALADAGGLTALALGADLRARQIFGSSPLFGPAPARAGRLFLYACGFGLCAFSAVDRAPGPGWIGVAVLLATTVTAAGGKATLVGWPLGTGHRGRRAAGHRAAPEPAVAARPVGGEAHVFEIRSER